MAFFTPIENSPTVSTAEYSFVNNSTSIASNTTQGVFSLWFDLNAMVAGDQFQLRVLEKTVSGGTQRSVYEAVFTGAQGSPLVYLPGWHLKNGWDFTLKRLAGADRAIPYSIRGIV